LISGIFTYYKLLNCGFRIGWAAGTDFPCNNSQPFGSLLTYVQVKSQPFTYRQWVEGIKNGRTVVATNGHVEFLDLRVNKDASPGDEIKLNTQASVEVEVKWTSILEQAGRLEIVMNGKVVDIKEGSSGPGNPLVFTATLPIRQSSWICARRMDVKGHRSHTAPVYIAVNNKPVRANSRDPLYFVNWINTTLANTSPGGSWTQYFSHDQETVRNRYLRAKAIYEKIAGEALKNEHP
jgi:hypothetical protein